MITIDELEARRQALHLILAKGDGSRKYLAAIKQGYIDTLHTLIKLYQKDVEKIVITNSL